MQTLARRERRKAANEKSKKDQEEEEEKEKGQLRNMMNMMKLMMTKIDDLAVEVQDLKVQTKELSLEVKELRGQTEKRIERMEKKDNSEEESRKQPEPELEKTPERKNGTQKLADLTDSHRENVEEIIDEKEDGDFSSFVEQNCKKENKKKEIMSIPEERQLLLDEETGVLMADEEDRADEATAGRSDTHKQVAHGHTIRRDPSEAWTQKFFDQLQKEWRAKGSILEEIERERTEIRKEVGSR